MPALSHAVGGSTAGGMAMKITSESFDHFWRSIDIAFDDIANARCCEVTSIFGMLRIEKARDRGLEIAYCTACGASWEWGCQ